LTSLRHLGIEKENKENKEKKKGEDETSKRSPCSALKRSNPVQSSPFGISLQSSKRILLDSSIIHDLSIGLPASSQDQAIEAAWHKTPSNNLPLLRSIVL
jgi:hypothetical protein